MKKILMLLLVLITGSVLTNANAQSDSSKFNSEFTIATRNIFRGTGWGQSPSLQMKLNWTPCSYFEMGAYGNVTSNGTKEGYGNEFNYYMTFNLFSESQNKHLKNISITLDDYFYFNSNDLDNNYFDYASDVTQHFIEGRLKYDGRLDLTAAYTLYANENANTDGIYFEAGYNLNKNLYAFLGYLTDESALMFQEESGVCNIGLTHQKELNIFKSGTSVLKTSVIVNPNYESIYDLPGVGRNPIGLVASLTF